MNIKTPFKCYWCNQPEVIYTVTEHTDTHFMCNWVEFGDADSTDYLKSTMYELIALGKVVIIPLDPLVTIKQSEYDDLIEEINLLRELLAETTNVEECEDLSSVFFFKPISEYTLEDWQKAIDEDWEFECRDGHTAKIIELLPVHNYPVRGDDSFCRTINGHWWVDENDDDDIIKRIR